MNDVRVVLGEPEVGEGHVHHRLLHVMWIERHGHEDVSAFSP
jgi:hypothetical protein